MSAPLASVFVHTVFDGRAFVPTEPVDLPVGAFLDGVVRPPVALRPEKPIETQEEWVAFLDQTAGSWVGPEMEDPDDPPPKEPDF